MQKEHQKLTKTKNIITRLALIGLVMILVLPQAPVEAERSIDELENKIAVLEEEIDENKQQANQLQGYAKTLERTISKLNSEIATIQKEINLTELKVARTKTKLKETRDKLAQQKLILATSLREHYKIGNLTTIELFANSSNFSDFFNQKEYLNRVRSNIQDSSKEVAALEGELEDQQEEQQRLLQQQQSQRNQVANKRKEKNELLAETNSQEAEFRRRAQRLQKQQKRILAEIVSRSKVIANVGTGSYPWADYRKGDWNHTDSCTYEDDGDNWNYCYRQCTSYSAWKLHAEGYQAPLSYGDATNWDEAAEVNGIKTSHKPKVGAIAVWNGAEGHVAYVEQIYEDGTVRISEYNAVPALKGKYSERIINPSDPATYIYFPR